MHNNGRSTGTPFASANGGRDCTRNALFETRQLQKQQQSHRAPHLWCCRNRPRARPSQLSTSFPHVFYHASGGSASQPLQVSSSACTLFVLFSITMFPVLNFIAAKNIKHICYRISPLHPLIVHPESQFNVKSGCFTPDSCCNLFSIPLSMWRHWQGMRVRVSMWLC